MVGRRQHKVAREMIVLRLMLTWRYGVGCFVGVFFFFFPRVDSWYSGSNSRSGGEQLGHFLSFLFFWQIYLFQIPPPCLSMCITQTTRRAAEDFISQNDVWVFPTLLDERERGFLKAFIIAFFLFDDLNRNGAPTIAKPSEEGDIF